MSILDTWCSTRSWDNGFDNAFFGCPLMRSLWCNRPSACESVEWIEVDLWSTLVVHRSYSFGFLTDRSHRTSILGLYESRYLHQRCHLRFVFTPHWNVILFWSVISLRPRFPFCSHDRKEVDKIQLMKYHLSLPIERRKSKWLIFEGYATLLSIAVDWSYYFVSSHQSTTTGNVDKPAK